MNEMDAKGKIFAPGKSVNEIAYELVLNTRNTLSACLRTKRVRDKCFLKKSNLLVKNIEPILPTKFLSGYSEY
jgi:hypothetical protein